MAAETPGAEPIKEEISVLAHQLNRNQRIQYRVCERLQRRHLTLGILTIALSSLITVIMTFPEFKFGFLDGFPAIKLVPVLALATAIVGALQTFLRLDSRASEHQNAGVRYGIIHRFAKSRISGGYSEDENRAALEEILEEYKLVSERAPLTWRSIRDKEE